MGMMSIRAIGSPSASVGSVAGAYVDYLTNGIQSKGQITATNLDGTISYYDSGIEGPGIWSGHGAQRLGLGGFIDPEDLESVLSGRHHETGERLLSAQGSAGRHTLKVGAATREIDGEPVWSRHDLESRLKLDGEVLTDLLEELNVTFHSHEGTLYLDAEAVDQINEHHAANQDTSAGAPSRLIDGKPVWSVTDLESNFDLDGNAFDRLLDTVTGNHIEHDQQSYLSADQVEQFTNAIENLARLEHLSSLKPDALLGAGEAAELVGVSKTYIQKVIGHHQDYEDRNIEHDDRDKDWLPANKVDPDNPNSHWRIRAEDLAGFIDRRQPPAVRIAYDVTFTFEKSISVVGMLSEGDNRDAFTTAVQRANQVGIDWLDHQASDGRHRGKAIHSEGLTVASFMHSTSRNDDPFVHVHNLVINAVEDQNGTGRALDARNLYMQGPTASALASAELRWQLSHSLGVKWTATGNAVEIAGINEGVIDEFSTGRNRIQSLAEEAGIDSARERQHIATESRPTKTGEAPDDLTDDWWQRAQRHGLDANHLQHNVLGHDDPLPSETLADNELIELHNWLASREGATRNASIFTKGDLLKTIGEWTPKGHEHVRIMPAAEMEKAADAFLTSPHVVPLALDSETVAELAGKTSAKMQHSEVFSTSRMVDLQGNINEAWNAGLDNNASPITADTLAAALAAAPTLTSAQRHLVTEWTTSGHQFQSAVGVPGAGKTFAVNAAARAWEQDGYKVIGTAVGGSAAQHLGQDAQIPSETLAYYLTQIDQYGNSPFDAKTVLVVDEAGTIPDEDLSQLLRHATDAGTTVRFLGDPEQHGAVNAGGMWKHLAATHAQDTPELLESFRFKDSPVDVEVNDLLRDGQIDQALRALKDAGNLIEVGSEQEALVHSLRSAVADRAQGNANPMIDRRNSNRVLLNEAMQQIRVDNGEVTQLTNYGHKQYGVGDEIVSKQNNRQLHPDNEPDAYLRNGSTGVITQIAEDRTAIADFGDGPIPLQPDVLETNAFRLGYAVTSNAVQGATLPTSNSHSAPGASKAELVVNLSRAVQDNQIVLSGNEDDEFSQFYEDDGRTLATQVAESISPSQDVPASIADPHANDRTTDLSALERSASPKDEIRLAQEVHARQVLADPPAEITTALPARPTVPHLAHAYDNAIVNASIYNATYTPPQARGPWSDLLGERPTERPSNAAQVERYDHAVTGLTTAAVATATRAVDDLDLPTPLPDWAASHLEELAHTGNLTPNFDPAAFADWAQKADVHQHMTGVLPRSDTSQALASNDTTHGVLVSRHADALQGNKPVPDNTPQERIEVETLSVEIEAPARGISL